MSTFTIGYAVMYDETAESFQWVFSHFIDAYGKGACEAVHMVMGDEDHGQNAGFERVQQVLHSSVSFLFSCLCVCLRLCVCVVRAWRVLLPPTAASGLSHMQCT